MAKAKLKLEIRGPMDAWQAVKIPARWGDEVQLRVTNISDDDKNRWRRLVVSHLLPACRCALADLEGVLPDLIDNGCGEPATQTIQELREAIAAAEEALE